MSPPPGPQGLFADPAANAPASTMVSRLRVLKMSSVLLYEALAGVYTALGFDVVGVGVGVRASTISSLPGSLSRPALLDIDRVLAKLGRRSVSLSTRKRTLRRCHDGKFRDQIATAGFTRALSHQMHANGAGARLAISMTRIPFNGPIAFKSCWPAPHRAAVRACARRSRSAAPPWCRRRSWWRDRRAVGPSLCRRAGR